MARFPLSTLTALITELYLEQISQEFKSPVHRPFHCCAVNPLRTAVTVRRVLGKTRNSFERWLLMPLFPAHWWQCEVRPYLELIVASDRGDNGGTEWNDFMVAVQLARFVDKPHCSFVIFNQHCKWLNQRRQKINCDFSSARKRSRYMLEYLNKICRFMMSNVLSDQQLTLVLCFQVSALRMFAFFS